jgi:hypothetical protein
MDGATRGFAETFPPWPQPSAKFLDSEAPLSHLRKQLSFEAYSNVFLTQLEAGILAGNASRRMAVARTLDNSLFLSLARAVRGQRGSLVLPQAALSAEVPLGEGISTHYVFWNRNST